MFATKLLLGLLAILVLGISVVRAFKASRVRGKVVIPGVLGVGILIAAFSLPYELEDTRSTNLAAIVPLSTTGDGDGFTSSPIQDVLNLPMSEKRESRVPSEIQSTNSSPILRCRTFTERGLERKEVTVQTKEGTFAINGYARSQAVHRGWKDGRIYLDSTILLRYLNLGLDACQSTNGTKTIASVDILTHAPIVGSTTPDAKPSKLTVEGLYKAAQEGNVQTIQRYIDAKFNLNVRTMGSSAVVQAAAGGHCDVLRRLLDAGAKSDSGEAVGFTAVTLATVKGYTECVRVLMEKKARVDVRTEPGGDTALIIAAYHGHLEIVKLLVQAGANRTLVNKDNDNALRAAQVFSNHSVVRYLNSL